MRTAVLALVLAFAVAPASDSYHGVAVAPDGLNAWVVTIDSTGLYHTPDLGQTWQPQHVNTVRYFFGVFFLDDQNGWTCHEAGAIYHTTDGGDSWVRQNLGGPKFASRIQFTDANHGWSSGGAAILLKTDNGGQSWSMVFFPGDSYPSHIVDFQGLSFVDSLHGWMVAGRYPEGDSFYGGQGYITRTTDGGDSWVLQRHDTVYDFYDIAFADTENGWAVGGNDLDMSAVVMHTGDAGAHWAPQALPSGAHFLRGVHFVNPSQGWACGRNGTIIHTSNGGATWEAQTSGVDTTLFDVDFADTLRGMIAGNSTVFYTTDGGQNWTRTYVEGVAEGPPVPGEGGRASLALAGNPARGRARFELTDLSGRFTVSIYDVAGSLVSTLSGNTGGSRATVSWDGRRRSGDRAPSGLYLARLNAGRSNRVLQFVFLRE